MQKLRGYLALGIFIMGIVSLLCLLLPLIEITDDALLLMVFAVPPLICGLIIALALHMLLYTLLLVLYGCRIQLVALYFLQYIRRKTVGWRVQYLPAAERKVGILLAAVPWEKETGRQQERARTALFYVQTALAILFYALAVNLYGTASAIACLVLEWGVCVSRHHHAAKRNSESIPARKAAQNVADAVLAGGEPDGSPVHGNAGRILHAAGQNSESE